MLQAPLPSCGYRTTNFWRIVEPEPLHEETFDKNEITQLNDAFQTPLHIAVSKGRLEPVERILDSMHFDSKTFAQKDTNNRTVLHYAAALPTLTIFKTLIEHPFATGDVVGIQDSNNQTAMDIVADRSDIETLDELGFSKDVWLKRDSFGQTILHRNMLHASANQIIKILHHPNMTASIFDAINHEGQSALHLASLIRSSEKVEAFLTHPFITPALVCLKDKHGMTAKKIFEGCKNLKSDHINDMKVLNLFEKFTDRQKQIIKRFLPPLETESGLHYKGLSQCFDSSAYPYMSFAPVLNKAKRPNQVKIFAKSLAYNLHKLKTVLGTQIVHQEKHFRVEVRNLKNHYKLMLVNQENWFGTEETCIFEFKHLAEPKLLDFTEFLQGSPVVIIGSTLQRSS